VYWPLGAPLKRTIYSVVTTVMVVKNALQQ